MVSATQKTRYDQKFDWLLPTLHELRSAIRTANTTVYVQIICIFIVLYFMLLVIHEMNIAFNN